MNINLIVFYFFLLIGFLVIIKNLQSKTYSDFFWFCDFAPFLFAIFFLINNLQLIKSLINIGLLTQFITSVLLIVGFVSRSDINGTKKAESHGKFYVFVELLIHVLPVNAALILTLNTPPEAKSLFYSFMILVAMFILTLMFTSPKNNINLVYDTSFDIKGKKYNIIDLPHQKYLWVLYAFLVVLVTFIIQLLILKLG